MQQKSSIAAALLSFFIPFYMLYWFYDRGNEMTRRGAKVPVFILLVGPYIALITLTLVSTLGRSGGAGASARIIFNLLAGTVIAFIICQILYLYKFSAAADQLSAGKASKVVSFLLFLFISPAAVYIIQDALNTVGQGPVVPGSQTPLPPTFSGPQANPYQ